MPRVMWTDGGTVPLSQPHLLDRSAPLHIAYTPPCWSGPAVCQLYQPGRASREAWLCPPRSSTPAGT